MLERTGKQVDIAISHSAQGFKRSSLKSQKPTPSYNDPPLLKITHHKGWSVVRSASHYTTTKKKKKDGNTFLKSLISKSKQNLQISNYQYCRKSINSYPWRDKTNFTHLRSRFFPPKTKKQYIAIGKTDLFYNSMGLYRNFTQNVSTSHK